MGIRVRSFFLNGYFHKFAFEVLRDFDVDNILFRLNKLEEFEHVCLFLIVKIINTLNLCKFFYTAIKINPNFVFKLVEAMALVLKENLLNYAEYAVWKIEEEPEFYRAGLILNDWETNYLNNITHPKRKLTWLASRFLLKQLIDTDVFVELLFDEHGKPYVTNFDIFVSLSHSNEHAAAIVSKSFEVGIDVEEPHRKIEIIKNKFLSTVELNNIGETQVQQQLLIYWSAKEVMYKIYGKRKLEFKDDMYVKPFLLNERGDINGILMKNGLVAEYHMHYLLNTDFTLVVGAEKEVSVINQPG